MSEPKGIDHLSADRIWSESVYADCVSEDGQSGFIIRLCRYPEQNTSWLWAHAFFPEKLLAYNDNYLPCPGGITRVEEDDVSYVLTGKPAVVLKRTGARDQPLGARVICAVMAHPDPDAVNGPGPLSLQIEAELRPGHHPWRPNKYRSEWLGDVSGIIETVNSRIEIQGLGHWHEQHQKAPRWQVPFTYLTLRGPNLALIATAMKDDDTGFILRGSEMSKVISIFIDLPGKRRAFRFTLEDGPHLSGEIITTHEYTVPIYDQRRPGTLVMAVVGKERLSGCVNDWLIKP
ncbi:MAG: hypothetical protein HY787_27305 [Deltaproteobacteria bacterium]|nr:hypothetical protein [Deltaproteobacteria bacterium]